MIFGLLYLGYLISTIIIAYGLFIIGDVEYREIKSYFLIFLLFFTGFGVASVWILDLLPEKISRLLDNLSEKKIIKKFEALICGFLGGIISLLLLFLLYPILSTEGLVVAFVFFPLIAVFIFILLVIMKTNRSFWRRG